VPAADLVVMGSDFILDSGYQGVDAILLQHLTIERRLAEQRDGRSIGRLQRVACGAPRMRAYRRPLEALSSAAVAFRA
jgi:hypothetical protein